MSEKIKNNILLWNNDLIIKDDTTFLIGIDENGNQVTFNIEENPHLLCFGFVASGTSTMMKNILNQMVNKGWKLFLFDMLNHEFSMYKEYHKVSNNIENDYKLLKFIDEEIKARKVLLKNNNLNNIKEYNMKVDEKSKLSYIGCSIEEILLWMDIYRPDEIKYNEIKNILTTFIKEGHKYGMFLLGTAHLVNGNDFIENVIFADMNTKILAVNSTKKYYDILNIDKNKINEFKSKITKTRPRKHMFEKKELYIEKGWYITNYENNNILFKSYWDEDSILNSNIKGRLLCTLKEDNNK